MGACSSKESEASATVHATGPDTPGKALPAPGLKRAAAPAGPLTARLAKRGAVGEAEHVSEAEDTLASLPKVAKSSTEAALISAAIADNILFKDLVEPELRSLLVDALQPLTVPAGTVVIQQGAKGGDTFYVVQSGTCEVLVNGVAVATKGSGTAFGELALLYACPRAATVRAVDTTHLWVLHQRWYRLVTRSAAAFRVEQKVKLLRNVPFFGGLTDSQLAKVAECLAPEDFAPGSPIITKGDLGDCFYMLRSGAAIVTDGTKQLATVQPGGFFGERALLNDDVRAANVTVPPGGPSALCYVLSRSAFKAALAMVEETFRCDALKGLPLLAPLTAQQLVTAAGAMTRMEVAVGSPLLTKGAPLDGIYIVESGNIAVHDAEPGCAWPCTLPRGFTFGVTSLLPGGALCPASLAVVADGQSTPPTAAVLLRLSISAFEAQFGSLAEVTAASRVAALRRVPLLAALPPEALLQLSREVSPQTVTDGTTIVRQGDEGDCFYLLESGTVAVLDAGGKEVARLAEGAYFGELALLKNDTRKATVAARGDANLLVMTRASFAAMRAAFPAVAAGLAHGEAGYVPVAYASRIGLKDVRLKRALGAGTFGKVWLCTHKDSVYALKQVAKAQVVKKGLVQHVKRERDVMAECSGASFLVGLTASFQDEQFLYLMMDLIPGGELFYYLQSLPGPLPEPSARFYTACVVEAFSFLHSRFYIYRDLKPENLLICGNGYIKVADFSFVKRLRAGKTYTLCGTPAYLAPEQITRAGHDRGVDWWALGVLTYEMLAGMSPFYHEDDMVMFRRVVDVKYSFLPPVPKMSYEAKDLVNALLQKAPHQRLPMGRRGVAALHDHLWFKGFSWEGLRDGRLKAPYVPKLKGADDLRFFPDCTHESPGSEFGPYSSVGNFAGFES